MEKFSFKLFKKDGTEAGRATFYGKSKRAAQASGQRYLARVGLRSANTRKRKPRK